MLEDRLLDTPQPQLVECVLKNLSMKELQNCVQTYSTMFSSEEKMLEEGFKNSLNKLRQKGFTVGQDGQTVYPKSSTKSYAPREDVPGMKKDVLILAQDYIDKKTRKPVNLTGRGEDAKIAQERGIPSAPIGWWMSEKFDGERALWDGKQMISRGGKVIWIPEWFKALMPPNMSLDGELFTGRGKFQELGFLRSTVKPLSERKKTDKSTKDLDLKWGNVLFKVFDVPHVKQPWEERMTIMNEIVRERCKLWKPLPSPYLQKPSNCPLQMTEFIKVENEKQLEEYFNTLLSKDAEGVMLRAPKSPYIPKRTRFLLKVKPDYDAECRITGYKSGTGKYEGVLGSFECEMIPEGKKFYISGMSDDIRKSYRQTHPVGTVVTYKYTFLTDDGIPRHPRYLRIRRSI